jgi:hypothetical protein
MLVIVALAALRVALHAMQRRVATTHPIAPANYRQQGWLLQMLVCCVGVISSQ